MKRIIALMLILMLAFSAAAEGSVIGKLYDAAVELAYDTHNVTLGAEATFSWDGTVFKTMHGTYKQDGKRSWLDYMLDTPKPDGSIYTGGYQVLGLDDGSVYSCDTYWGNYYNTGVQLISDTVLTGSNQIRAMLNLGRILAVASEPLAKCDVNGNVYSFTVEDLPEYVDAAAWYLIRDYIMDNYYRNLFVDESVNNTYTVVYYEDFTQLIRSLYFKLYNEEMPEDFNDDIISERYAVAYNWAEQQENEIRSKYTAGFVYIFADGTHKWYASEEDCMRENGIVHIDFADVYKALSDYYKIKTDDELTEDVLRLIIYTPNPEIYEAYNRLYSETEKYYTGLALEENPDCVRCFVNYDGTVSTYKTLSYISYRTTTDEILGETKFAELSSLNADVTVDEEGRLTGFAGNVTITATDRGGEKHELAISFELSAGDYGTTGVNSVFAPSDYGWITYEEYLELHKDDVNNHDSIYDVDWEEFVKNAPATIEFMGKTYPTMMEMYND